MLRLCETSQIPRKAFDRLIKANGSSKLSSACCCVLRFCSELLHCPATTILPPFNLHITAPHSALYTASLPSPTHSSGMQRSFAQIQRLAGRLAACRPGRLGGATFTTVQRASQRTAARPPWVAAPPLRSWHLRRPLTVSAAQEAQQPSSSHEHADVDLQLPTHCSGCGVPLQPDDPESPGCVWLRRLVVTACSSPMHETGCMHACMCCWR